MLGYQTVFKDETKLDINFVPYKLPHRDKELHLLKEFFSFILRSPEKMAQRVIVTGDIGTGKTAICQRFGNDIMYESRGLNSNVRYIHINCRECRGSLFLILYYAVTVFRPNFPKRGYSAEELLGTFTQILDEEKSHVILALDEFDSLIERDDSEAVYQLTRFQETRLGKPQRLSFIFIIRNLKALQGLDASARSTLQSNIIRLENYAKQQLVDILNDRVELAFKPLTVAEDTIMLVSELACNEGGNARFGIELLWRAGKYANAESASAVTAECVRKAMSSIIPSVPKNELLSLNLHERMLLLSIARLFASTQRTYVTLAEAEQAYAISCEEAGLRPNSHTQLWKYMRVLSALGIVKTEVSTTKSRGRSTLVYLPQIPAGELVKSLEMVLKGEIG